MGIDISPEHREFVREELESGRFSSEQELLDEAIELLRSRQGVLAKLTIGVAQLNRGEGTEYGPDDRQRFIVDVLGQASTAKEPS
jgi:Arc/MetJ-type ribon-helix-helix transcriptional regulator